MGKEIYTQEPGKYILKLAELLKQIPEFEVPEWANFVKTSTSRMRPPLDDDFWYIRAASMLRHLYIKGVVGVGKFRTKYGSTKNRGAKPSEFRKASGKIIRTILQQAEKAGLVEKLSDTQHGRRLTQTGRDFLDSVVVNEYPKLDLSEYTVPKKVNVVEVQEDGE